MTTHTTTLDLELIFGQNEARTVKVEVSYDYQPAHGDGWHEPRYPASVSLESATATVNGKTGDVLWLLSEDCIRAVEADLLKEVEWERKQRKWEAKERELV